MSSRALYPTRQLLRSSLRLACFTAVLAAGLVACTDSEITGDYTELPPPADADVEVTKDIPNDVPPVDCISDSQCDGVVGGSVCDESYCGPQGVCLVRSRQDCCGNVDDCPDLSGTPCFESTCPVPGEACRVIDTCVPPCVVDSDCKDLPSGCPGTATCDAGQCSYSVVFILF